MAVQPSRRPSRPIAQEYIWAPQSPLDRFPPSKFSPVPDSLAENFAIRAIEAQPLDYARAVFDDTWRVFAWKRHVFPNAQTYDEYVFSYKGTPIPSWDRAHLGKYDSYAAAYVQGNPNTQVVDPFAAIIRGYQRYVWLPGTVYGLILLAGLGGIVLAWRRTGRGGAAALGDIVGADRRPGGDRRVRLPVRAGGRAVRLPGGGHRVQPGHRGRPPGAGASCPGTETRGSGTSSVAPVSSAKTPAPASWSSRSPHCAAGLPQGRHSVEAG